jgi:tetratricopeptide (TPR) repeat protein
MRIYNYIFLLLNFGVSWVVGQVHEDSLYNVAVMSVYDNPDKSIELGSQILEKNSQNPKKQVQALLLISNAYASKRDYEKSLEYALKTKEIQIPEEEKILKMQILNKIAAQYHQLGVNDKALQILDEADLAAKKYEHKDSLHFLMGNNYAIRGFIYRDQLSCDVAIEYLQKAYQEFSQPEENPKTMANKSVTAYNIGNCYISLNQLDLAKQSFLIAKNLAEKNDAKSLTGFALKGLAEVYTLESNYTKALEELKKAETLGKEVGDLVLNRGIFQGLATNYLALKDWDQYQIYHEKYDNISQSIRENERATLNNILRLYSKEVVVKKEASKLKYGIIISIIILFLWIIFFFIFIRQKRFQKQFSDLKSQIKI